MGFHSSIIYGNLKCEDESNWFVACRDINKNCKRILH